MSDWYPKISYGEIVNQAATKFGDKEFMFFEGRRWSFRQAREDIDRAARALMALGVQAGDRVALWLPNRPEWVHVQFAVLKIGAILVPVNTQARSTDLRYVLRQSEASVLVATDVSGPVDYLQTLREVCPELGVQTPSGGSSFAGLPALRHVAIVSAAAHHGVRGWEDVLTMADIVDPLQLAAREAAVDPDATATIMYTSGSTGAPKGVMHSHRTVRNALDLGSRLGVRRDDVTMMYLPLFHAFGWCDGPLMSFGTGARMVLMSRFVASEALELVERERCTLLHGFDTHFKDLMEHPDFERRELSCVRTGVFPAGARGSEQIARLAHQKMGHFVSGWSMTELAPAASMGFPSDTEEVSACASGYPMPGYEIKIIDPVTGKDVPTGVTGEICCRSYAMMQGYFKMPEETARTIDADGWLHSGDMGQLRESGYLEFKGRYKEMLKVGGENVDPIEVEAHLMTCPGVSKVKVVGLADPRLHEVAVACVVPAVGSRVTEEDILTHCRSIASFKRPRRVLFVDDFPMTASGKVQKFNLSALVAERFGHQRVRDEPRPSD